MNASRKKRESSRTGKKMGSASRPLRLTDGGEHRRPSRLSFQAALLRCDLREAGERAIVALEASQHRSEVFCRAVGRDPWPLFCSSRRSPAPPSAPGDVLTIVADWRRWRLAV